MEWRKPVDTNHVEIQPSRADVFDNQFAVYGEKQAHLLNSALTAVESQGFVSEDTSDSFQPSNSFQAELTPAHAEVIEQLSQAFARSEIQTHENEIIIVCHLGAYDLQVILSNSQYTENYYEKQNYFKIFSVKSLILRDPTSRTNLDWMRILPEDVKLRLLILTDDTAQEFDGCFYNTGRAISFRGFRSEKDLACLLHEIGHAWNATVDPDFEIDSLDIHSQIKAFTEIKLKGIDAARKNHIRAKSGKSTFSDPLVDDSKLQEALIINANSERFASLFAQEIISRYLPNLKQIGEDFANRGWRSYDATALTSLVAVSETARNLQPEQRQASWQFYLQYLEARDELTYDVAESGQAVFETRVGTTSYSIDASVLAKGIIQLTVTKSIGRAAVYIIDRSSINFITKNLFGHTQGKIGLFDSVELTAYGKLIARIFSEISEGLKQGLLAADEAASAARKEKSKLLEEYFKLKLPAIDADSAPGQDLMSALRKSLSGEELLTNDIHSSLLSRQIDSIVTMLGTEFVLSTDNFDIYTGAPLATQWRRLMMSFRGYLISNGHFSTQDVVKLSDEELVGQVATHATKTSGLL